MNKKIKMFIILSVVVISLAGCSKTANDMKEEFNDAKNEAEDAVDEMNNDTINPDGNYNDEDGFIEDEDDIDYEDDMDYEDEEDVFSEPSAVKTMALIDTNKLDSLDNTKQSWGHGNNRNGNNQPVDAVNFQQKYGKYNAFFIRDLDKKNIYLTFDEGYENGYTAPILDVLKNKGVSAVFFVTLPYVKSNPDLINRMINEGHIIGNHSVKHKSFPTISIEEGKNEVEGLHNFMKENYDYDMKLFRFPSGEFSERSLELLNKLGYNSIFWSFAYADWDPNKQMDLAEAKNKILSAAHNGAIYLLHAVSKTNSEILGDIIDGLRDQGYNISKF